jgi:hypothetical protein
MDLSSVGECVGVFTNKNQDKRVVNACRIIITKV